MNNILKPSETISYIDIHLANLMQELSGRQDSALFLSTALVSSQMRSGHVCLDLNLLDSEAFGQQCFPQSKLHGSVSTAQAVQALQEASVVGKPGDFRPLILDGQHRLYLNRYWRYQHKLSAKIRDLSVKVASVADAVQTRERLSAYFNSLSSEEPDYQKLAAAVSLLKPFCAITGGPGTGKTHTVAKIIALLAEEYKDKPFRVMLAAPTGKAAIRLQESIRKVKPQLPCSDEIKEKIPDEAATIHRLLGWIKHSPYFRYNHENRLALDLLVVDEASMVDLALMAKLVAALPDACRLILLGDNNQLSSVEAGAVLGDICGDGSTTFTANFCSALANIVDEKKMQFASGEKHEMNDCIVHLQKSYRFDAAKGIGALSRAIRAGDADDALAVLRDPNDEQVQWRNLDMAELAQNVFEPLVVSRQAADQEHLSKINNYRILCAVRSGRQGVVQINDYICSRIRQMHGFSSEVAYYPGQPILITENDYGIGLFNGDLGVVGSDPVTHSIHVCFSGKDGEIRRIKPFRLPPHETAYAMTVHKSQGSEFKKICLMLPEQASPVLSRELIYTAVTRASEKVEIWANEQTLRNTINQKVYRSSGLRDELWASGTE